MMEFTVSMLKDWEKQDHLHKPSSNGALHV